MTMNTDTGTITWTTSCTTPTMGIDTGSGSDIVQTMTGATQTMDMVAGITSNTAPTMDITTRPTSNTTSTTISDPNPYTTPTINMAPTVDMADPNSYTTPTMDIADHNSYTTQTMDITTPTNKINADSNSDTMTMNMVTGTMSDTKATKTRDKQKIVLNTASTMNMMTGTISDTAPTMDINMVTILNATQTINEVTTSESYVTTTTTPNQSSSNQVICQANRNDGSMFTITDLKCLSSKPKLLQSKSCPSNIKLYTDGPSRLKINDISYNISDIISNNCYNYPSSNSCKYGNTDNYCEISRCVVSWAHEIGVQINGKIVKMIAHNSTKGTRYWTTTSNMFNGIATKSQYKALADCISLSCINCFSSPFTCDTNEKCKYA